MAEILGLVLGITGPLQQLQLLVEEIKQRCEAAGSHKKKIDNLVAQFSRMTNDLKALDTACFSNLSAPQVALVNAHLTDLNHTITTALPKLRNEQRKMTSFTYRFTRAIRNEQYIALLRDTATRCSSLIMQITCLLAVVDVPSQVANTMHTQPSVVPATAETFFPSFAVERNDRFVTLDFESTHDGAFATIEGRLKALVLGSAPTVGAVAQAVGTVAVGIGGVGKTCALRAIAQEPDVRRRFPGGIYFRSLGQDAGVTSVVAMLADFVELSGARRLGAETRNATLDTAVVKACAWFRSESCLFIIDDIWEANGIPQDILRKLSPLVGDYRSQNCASRIIYSTRDRQLASAACGAVVEFKRRSARSLESRNMLLEAAGVDCVPASYDAYKENMNVILDLCDGLPFTLNIAGRLLRKMRQRASNSDELEVWVDSANLLQTCNEKLLHDRRESYFSSLLMSITFLDANRTDSTVKISHEEAVESLCVLKKQDLLPVPILRLLWRIDENDAEYIVDNLESLGIVEQISIADGARRESAIRIHDHVHSHSTWLSRKNRRETLWYRKLVEGYKESAQVDERTIQFWPSKLVDDGYAVQNICRLLLQSGQMDTVRDFLTSAFWLTRMMWTGSTIQYKRDVESLLQHLKNASTGANSEHSFEWSCAEKALCERSLKQLSKLVNLSHPECIGNERAAWFQLYARLQSASPIQDWIRRIMQDAERHAPRPFVKSLRPCLSFPAEELFRMYPLGMDVKDVRYIDNEGVLACGFENGLSNGPVKISLLSFHGESISVRLRADSLSPHESGVSALSLSSNGLHIVSGHKSGAIRIWDTRSGQQTGPTMLSDGGSIVSIDLSSESTRLVASSSDGTVRVWDARNCRIVCDGLNRVKVNCDSTAISGEGSRVACLTREGGVTVWNVDTREVVRTVVNDSTELSNCVCMSHDGNIVAFGTMYAGTYLWDLQSDAVPEAGIVSLPNGVRTLCFSRDCAQLFLGCTDHTVRLWSLRSRAELYMPLKGHTGFLRKVDANHDGTQIVSGSSDQTVRVWHIEKSGLVEMEEPQRSTAISLNQLRGLVAIGSVDGKIRICDIRTGLQMRDAFESIFEKSIDSVCISENGQRLASASSDGRVDVWDIDNGELLCELFPFTTTGRSMDIDGEEGNVEGGSRGNAADEEDWDTRSVGISSSSSGSELFSEEIVGLSSDGSRVASYCGDNSLRVWDVESETLMYNVLHDHHVPANNFCLSGDGRRAVACFSDSCIQAWDVESKQHACTVMGGGEDSINCMEVKMDGSVAVSAGRHDVVQAWDLNTGSCVRRIAVNPMAVRTAFREACRVYIDAQKWPVSSPVLLTSGRHVMIKRGEEEEEVVAAFDADIGQSLSCDDGSAAVVLLATGSVGLLRVEM